MFVSDERIQVTEGDHSFFIRAKMSRGVMNRVMDEGTDIQVGANGQNVPVVHIGKYQTAMLVHNIIGWSGPAFHEFGKYEPGNTEQVRKLVDRLDPDEPLVLKVQAEIERRNGQRGADPNASSGGATGSAESVTPEETPSRRRASTSSR